MANFTRPTYSFPDSGVLISSTVGTPAGFKSTTFGLPKTPVKVTGTPAGFTRTTFGQPLHPTSHIPASINSTQFGAVVAVANGVAKTGTPIWIAGTTFGTPRTAQQYVVAAQNTTRFGSIFANATNRRGVPSGFNVSLFGLPSTKQITYSIPVPFFAGKFGTANGGFTQTIYTQGRPVALFGQPSGPERVREWGDVLYTRTSIKTLFIVEPR